MVNFTESQMRIESEIKLDFKDVLLRPKRSTLSSRKEVDLEREFTFPHTEERWKGVPIVAANMDHTGTFNVAKVLSKSKLLTCLQKHYTLGQCKEICELRYPSYVAISTGISKKDFLRLNKILKTYPKIKFICIDIANGYSTRFSDYVKKVRSKHKKKIIIAGNVVTGEMTEDLILNGADIVKVGIGPGSVCTTRTQTGVGYPQLSAIIECADAAHGVNGHVMADGGCTCAGDISKAFGAGGDFVMLGGMFAGHTECNGSVSENSSGEKSMEFYGMSSDTAMKKYSGGVANYRSSEGKATVVKYRGSIQTTIENILGGVRSTCTYIGAEKLKNVPKCTTFIRVTQQMNTIFGKNN